MTLLDNRDDILQFAQETMDCSNILGKFLKPRLSLATKELRVVIDCEIEEGFPIEGSCSYPKQTSIEALAGFIYRETHGKECMAVLVNECARPSHPFAFTGHDFSVCCDEDIYCIIPNDMTIAQIEQGIINAETALTLAGIIIPLSSEGLKHRARIPHTLVREWAEKATHLILGAFDGETYVIWPL
jgi:hypothetical protein